jgi:hypothetical protein
LESILIYQTLKNKENPDYIKDNGPFKCNWKNSWAGEGYYFWDSFIENAHWWGSNHQQNNYIIAEAKIDVSTSTCFDLVGNTKHMKDFGDSIDLMKSKNLFKQNTTVARVIHYMKDTLKIFDFYAIRLYGINSKDKNLVPNYRISFELKKPQYLDYKPAIQICIYNISKLNFKNWQIVYPDEYIEGYVV